MNANLTILKADKGNASVTINPSGYILKIGAFLEEPAWRRLAKDTIETVENMTTLKTLALAAEVSFSLSINHQSTLHNTSKSKNHKMRWHAYDSFLDWNNWNRKQPLHKKS